MKIGFDLDGTLDRAPVRALAKSLLADGHEIFVISGCFLEAGDWQNHDAKYVKLERMGFPVRYSGSLDGGPGWDILNTRFHVAILDAVSHERFDRQYRLVDLGLRKGAYIAAHGIEMMFDDSALYCETMPSMCGAQVLRVL